MFLFERRTVQRAERHGLPSTVVGQIDGCIRLQGSFDLRVAVAEAWECLKSLFDCPSCISFTCGCPQSIKERSCE